MEEGFDVNFADLNQPSPPDETKAFPMYPDRNWKGRPLSSLERQKVVKLLSLCDGDQNIDKLIGLCSSKDGLVNDEVRKKACTLLSTRHGPPS